MHSSGVQRIADERARHFGLGYTPEHDAEHADGELLAAAICYLAAAHPPLDPDGSLFATLWPWPDAEMPAPTDDLDHLLAAGGALAAAEIDRLHAAERRAIS